LWVGWYTPSLPAAHAAVPVSTTYRVDNVGTAFHQQHTVAHRPLTCHYVGGTLARWTPHTAAAHYHHHLPLRGSCHTRRSYAAARLRSYTTSHRFTTPATTRLLRSNSHAGGLYAYLRAAGDKDGAGRTSRTTAYHAIPWPPHHRAVRCWTRMPSTGILRAFDALPYPGGRTFVQADGLPDNV